MEPKKNPKTDLNRNRSLYFITGLMLVMALTYVALEWKTYDDPLLFSQDFNTADDILEEAPPLIDIKLPPPLPPAVTPAELEIVPDDDPIIETLIESTEPEEDVAIVSIDSVKEVEVEEDLDVPFSVIEDVPVFPGCENDDDKRACFNNMILKHVRKTFRYPEIAQDMGIQGRVYMNFVIQKDGSIGNIKIMRSPDKNLGTEATRIITKLPKMTPGKQRGKAVRVPFSIPITFKLQ